MSGPVADPADAIVAPDNTNPTVKPETPSVKSAEKLDQGKGDNPVNADEDQQRKLLILQAQQVGIEGNLNLLQDQLNTALQQTKGDDLGRKINAILRLVLSNENQLQAVNTQIQSLLTQEQLPAQFEAEFQYSLRLEDFKQEILEQQTVFFKAYPHSTAKPRDMVIPQKQQIDDTKLVKLPTLELVTFSGDHTLWTSFIDTFDSLVGNKPNIPDTAKLSYLKSVLRGDPKTLIGRLESNNAGNYDRARKLLKDRYENTRSIVRVHIDSIVNHPAIKADNGPQLQRFIEKLDDNLEGLRQLGIETKEWGPLLVYHVHNKLDNDTRKDFEIKHPGTTVQSLPVLQKFLRERALALEMYSTTAKKGQDSNKTTDKSTKDQKGGVYTGQAEVSLGTASAKKYTKYPCGMCDTEGHTIYRCKRFAELTVDDRTKQVREWEGCLNCLQKGHIATSCESKYRCKSCDKPHHSLLHFAKANDVKHNPKGKKGVAGANHLVVVNSTLEVPKDQEPQPASGMIGTQPLAETTLAVQQPVSTAGPSDELPHARGYVSAGFQDEDTAHETGPLLGTAQVPIRDINGEVKYGRALLDSGSQLNFITTRFAKSLGLPRLDSKCTVHTIGAVHPSATVGSVRLVIELPEGDTVPMHAHILTTVTGVLPSQHIDISEVLSPKWPNLADDNFDKPGEIDLLVGVEVYEQLMMADKKQLGTLTATRSRVGWVISGTAALAKDDDPGLVSDPFVVGHVMIDRDIIKFWEVNDIRDTSVLAKSEALYTPEERYVHAHFDKTTTVSDDGRLSVSLPFKEPEAGQPKLELGCSRGPAVKMLLAMETKFARNPAFQKLYQGFVQEFVDMGHLVEVNEKDINKLPNSSKYYLPHHAVEKESTTTKLRVVMNASAKSSTGVTLNQLLAVGPTLQDQLVCHLVRYRFHRVALSGDISKMYRQIALNDKDKKFHLFLWRDTPGERIRCYEMTRVTYGVASSSYHAVRALQEAAKRSGLDKEVVDAALRDFYVDDVMTGASSVAKAQQLMLDLILLMKQSQLLIRKWASNEPSIIMALPQELRENVDAFDVTSPDHSEHTLKTLGIRWNPSEDVFIFTVNHVELESELLGKVTKRELLADILKLFDPMGWLSPVTLKLKIFMQTTWAQGLAWDEPLPVDIRDNFLAWRSHLITLRSLQIPRCILAPGDTVTTQFHVFCDASELGYAACVYVRVVDSDSQVSVNLLFAKAKVAPVKAQSIPRLELMAALLGTKVLTIALVSVAGLGVVPDRIFAYSDSTTVLAWLSKPSRTWATFVQNRVSDIQAVVQRPSWFHVRSEENPADVASRGLSPELLASNTLWFHGPPWLSSPNFEVPDQSHLDDKTATEVRKDPPVCMFINPGAADPPEQFQDLSKTSRFERHVRVTVHVLRFLAAFKTGQHLKNVCISKIRELNNTMHPFPSPAETTYVRRAFIMREQRIHLGSELATLAKGGSLPRKHHLSRLYPFVDNGVMKVGGRLHASDTLPEERKYQDIIPKKSALAKLLVAQVHDRLLCGTLQGCLAALASTYWVVGARELIRKHIRACTKCYRYACKPVIPLMGDLPKERVTPNKPFDHVGIDFAGPFLTRITGEYGAKSGPLKTKKNPSTPDLQTKKSYLAVFVCFSTKAVHLEAVGSLSGPCCIAAFTRFVATRGAPVTVYSDNGSNFIGTAGELARLKDALDKKGKEGIPAAAAAEYGTQWVHIPPRAPHFGGLWETAVKSAKSHLRKVVGKNVFTFEELSTVYKVIESCLNSRPLVELSSDQSDFQALTPAMLVCGKQIRHLPMNVQEQLPATLPITETHPAKRWAHITKTASHFWKRWYGEYLPTLQVRKKWTVEQPNFKINELVLVAEDNVKPLQWPLARILEAYPGNDGVVRVAKIQTPSGVYTRPVAKLRRLPIPTQNS